MGGDELCPGCGKVLYPTPSLRPGPSLGRQAITVLGLGLAAAAVMYIVGLGIIIEFAGLTLRELSLVAALWLLASATPALIAGRMAYRYPREVKHLCRSCGWRGGADQLKLAADGPKG